MHTSLSFSLPEKRIFTSLVTFRFLLFGGGGIWAWQAENESAMLRQSIAVDWKMEDCTSKKADALSWIYKLDLRS